MKKRIFGILLTSLIGFAVVTGGFMLSQTCFVQNTFYSQGDIVRFSDEERGSHFGSCTCAGYVKLVSQCVYYNSEIANAPQIKSELGTQLFDTILVEAKDKTTAQTAAYLANPKAFPVMNSNSISGVNGPTKVFKVVSHQSQVPDIKQNIDSIKQEITERKDEYCFRLMQLPPKPSGKLIDQQRIPPADEVMKRCIDEPGQCVAATRSYGTACSNERWLLLAFDCFRGHCDNDLRNIPNSLSLKPSMCASKFSTCGPREILQTACLGNDEACKSSKQVDAAIKAKNRKLKLKTVIQASQEPSVLEKIKRADLPCHYRQVESGFALSKPCPQVLPEVTTKVLGLRSIAYSPNKKRFYAVQDNIVLEIDEKTGEASPIKPEDESARWSHLSNLALDVQNDRFVVITYWHSPQQWVVDLKDETISSMQASGNFLHSVANMINGNVAYNAALKNYVSLSTAETKYFDSDLTLVKSDELNDQTKLILNRVPNIQRMFTQTAGDYLIILPTTAAPLAVRLSDQKVFEVTE